MAITLVCVIAAGAMAFYVNKTPSLLTQAPLKQRVVTPQ